MMQKDWVWQKPSLFWVGIFLVATGSKQGNFVCSDVVLDGIASGVLRPLSFPSVWASRQFLWCDELCKFRGAITNGLNGKVPELQKW